MAYKAISIFSGAGGLDYGFEAAGFETRVALDLDSSACHFLRRNRDWPVVEGAIADVPSKTLLDTAQLSRGDADVLIGGPPCQPFSKSGYWASGDARRLEDPRSDTLGQYLRILEDTLPKAFLLENVPGLAYKGKNEGIEKIRRGVENINARNGTSYTLEFKSINAADFGVPQLRERVFVVGSRDGKTFLFPSPTHASRVDSNVEHELIPYSTAWDALGDLPPVRTTDDLKMSGKWADLLPTIPEGMNYLWHTERGGGVPLFGWRRRYWNFLLKLSKELPSWTVQAQPGPATGPFHWDNRKLSALELARLQTFPDDLVFDCTRSDAQKLLGNAVASALAEVLAREIAIQFLGQRRRNRSLRLIPETRIGRPQGTSKLAAVPSKYLKLANCDDAHPGTGQGRRAQLRSNLATAA